LTANSKISFFGGVKEIGGNKILLEDKGTRVLLDFGKSFKARSRYYDWNEVPRLANGIGDFLSMGLLPDLAGIYREDLLSLAGRKTKEDRLVQALFLSHAHSDHADYISFLREDIDVYMGETTKRIIESLESERNATLEFEITGYKQRPANKGSTRIPRKISTFKTGSKKIQIDSIEVEPIHVDHSIPGCYGFIIRTTDRLIVYSGDLRIHGNNPSLTRDFIEKAAEAKPDLMLCEGTRVDETTLTREKDVLDTCKYFVERSKDHLVYADYSYKDIDRFTTFYNIAKSTGRSLVIHPKVARYLRSLSSDGNPLRLPSLDQNILIYKPRGKSGEYADHDYSKEDLAIYDENQDTICTAERVKHDPSKVIIAIGSNYIDQLVDIVPSEGLYLHSTSEPFNEEGAMSEEKMSNWLERFGLQRIHAHCSGHASGKDLSEIVNLVQPKLLVPIHTEHEGLFELLHGPIVRLPELMKEMQL
jgi:ribonuclease J